MTIGSKAEAQTGLSPWPRLSDSLMYRNSGPSNSQALLPDVDDQRSAYGEASAV
jgi:hypothetical protein